VIYGKPIVIAIFIAALVISIVHAARQVRTASRDSEVLEVAKRDGVLSPDLERRWRRDRRVFALMLGAIALFWGWLVWYLFIRIPDRWAS
jgi:hypothetical protein